MIILIGKSGSGKSTIANILCRDYGCNKIVTTTTRPKRRGEKQDIDYHFTTKQDFKNTVLSGGFIETREYNVATGDTWYYGSPVNKIEQAKENDIIILTPDGCRNVIDTIGRKNIIVIYIYANLRAIENRLEKRGDRKDEIERRMKQDNSDFKDAVNLADFTVYNHYGDDINEVVTIIIKYLRERGVDIGKA